MSDVVKISDFRHKSDLAQSTPLEAGSKVGSRYDVQSEPARISVSGSSQVAAAVLYEEGETELSRFFDTCLTGMKVLTDCKTHLAEQDNFSADSCLIDFKSVAAELFVLRGISEPIGLISLKLLQASKSLDAITQNPDAVNVMRTALNRLWASPFMSFDQAIVIAEAIEKAADVKPLPGYNELADILIAEATSGN